jgi:hypothetical protein
MAFYGKLYETRRHWGGGGGGWIGFVGFLPRGNFLRFTLSSVCFPFLLIGTRGVLFFPVEGNLEG